MHQPKAWIIGRSYLMFDLVREKLSELEDRESVKIIYACESGSRAWGFPSANSDYDVRFIYVRDADFYLSIDVEDRRDVIELPIVDELDISGWDLRKAFKLLRKSNPPLLEWLTSPIVYLQDAQATQKIRSLIQECYSPVACCYHYLQMARGNYREYLKGETVKVKKYFYVLRPLLAIRWIEDRDDVMPMEFGKLVEHSIESPELRLAIEELIERKKNGEELAQEPRIDVISDFIDAEIKRLENGISGMDRGNPSSERLNSVFREILGSADRSKEAAKCL